MTLNLIIPVYNDYDGLITTLLSLNAYNIKHDINIMVINDCSTDGKNYKYIINLFKPFYNIQMHKTPYNMGAGNARQYGLDKINNDYVMFLDAGDILYSPIEFIEYLNFIENNPKTLLFSPQHFEQRENGEYASHCAENNRLHGKVYQVSFLKKYDIRFYKDYPNMNEDIGFNMTCRAYCRHLQNIDPNTMYSINYNVGIVVWTFNANSLTRKDDYAFYYKQNIGVSKQGIYMLNHVLEHGVPLESMQEDIVELFINLYVFYIGTLNRKEEYAEESFKGALEFYTHVLAPYSLNINLLTRKYNEIIGAFLRENNTVFCEKIPKIGILDFLLMLDNAYQALNKKQEGDNND